MIIFKDLGFITRSDKPNEDWTNGETCYVVDDNSELARKIMSAYPYYEPVEDENGNLIDVIPLERPSDIEQLREERLSKNSTLCNQIIENEFKSDIKGDGLQPYRMNGDDQTNLSSFKLDIMFAIALNEQDKLPLFPWKNANQIKCEPNWHYSEILQLITEFSSYKISILKRQDDIKEQIFNAETKEELNAVEIDYSDLLNFGGGDSR